MEEQRDQIPVLKPGVEFAEPNEKQPEIDAATRKMYEDSLPKSVQILTNSGTGSGFWMDKEGTIGTAAHVVMGSREQFATASDGTKYKLQIVKVDDINDLAILKPIGYKPGSYPIVELGNSKELNEKDPIYPIGHPQGRRPAYISPGEFGVNMKNQDLLLSLHPMSEEDLDKHLELAVTPKELEEMKIALKRDLLAADVHIRPGDSGGPAFDASGKVIGINDMITSFKKGFFVPVEKLQALNESTENKFEITYNRLAEPWAQDYKSKWSERPVVAAGETATALGAGYFANRAIAALPRTSGTAATLGGGAMLYTDVNNLLASTDPMDKVKYSIAGASDLVGMAGGAALMISRNRIGGAIGIGLGVAGRIAADFLPTRLVLTDIERKSNPLMPPFNHEMEKTLGL